MNRTLLIVVGVVAVLAIAGGSFYGGMTYGKAQAQAALTAAQQQFVFGGAAVDAAGTPGPGGARVLRGQGQGQGLGGGAVFGQIEQIETGGLLVLTDQTGKENRVKVTETTLIEKNASVSIADLQVGETVVVSGSAGADGIVTARSVQVMAAGRLGLATPGARTRP
jgi:hypothetical protein